MFFSCLLFLFVRCVGEGGEGVGSACVENILLFLGWGRQAKGKKGERERGEVLCGCFKGVLEGG